MQITVNSGRRATNIIVAALISLGISLFSVGTLSTAERINVNAANESTIKRILGVDSKTAKAIIKGRPYKSAIDFAVKLRAASLAEGTINEITSRVTFAGADDHPAPRDAGVLTRTQPDALYKDLGGKKGITTVVDLFVNNSTMDPRISSFFKADVADAKKLAKFKMNLVSQICEASGGPCKYTGKSMKEAHAGMGITRADFAALVEDLVAALDEAGVKPADKMALLGVLGPMSSDLVEK